MIVTNSLLNEYFKGLFHPDRDKFTIHQEISRYEDSIECTIELYDKSKIKMAFFHTKLRIYYLI